MKKFVFVLWATVVMAGCSQDYKCNVRSDTSWSGSFDGRTIDGSGNQTIDISDEAPACVVVQKQTEGGYLSVKIYSEGGWFLNPSYDGETVNTTAAYGVVSACSE